MAYYGSQYSAYGAMPQQLEAGLPQRAKPAKPFSQKMRMRMTMKAVCTCLFFPWLLFIALYALVTFSIHYSSPAACWILVSLAALLVLAIGGVAWQKTQESSQASWLWFLFFSSVIAVVGGALVGDINYWTNMQPYYELETLNGYDSVNPATSQGKQMMDAGKVSFTSAAALDLTKAFQFQDLESYCVAPISVGTSPMGSYDFWAIGLNCCGWNSTKQFDYKCGPYKSSTAKQGLRLMNGNQQEYYRLAVQQAEAQYKITARHPLLFYWSEDAKVDMLSYWEYGHKYFLTGIGASFAVQLFLLLVATVVFSKNEF